MSLKAKIEAVIYASEEPVTLAQLVGLLGEEAQAELDRETAAQQTLSLNEAEAAVEADPALLEDFDAAGVGGPAEVEAIEAAAEPASENSEVRHPAESASEGQYVERSAELASEVLDVERSNELPSEGQDVEHPGVEVGGSEEAGPLDSETNLVDVREGEGAAAAKAEKARATKLRAYFRTTLDRLIAEYAAPESDRGLEIREVAGGFRFATKPEYHDAVRGFVKSLKPPLKLSLQALETLAVVAYKQPVTSPEISEIRGVDSSGVLGSLIARKLITTAGRKHVIGRPILYKTTKEFLLKFGLKDIGELPSIEEFEQMAGQMTEQEEMAMGSEQGESAEAPEALETPEEVEERLESDGELPPPEPVADEVILDGRLSGLPPRYDDADDPSAREAEIEAEIQSGEES